MAFKYHSYILDFLIYCTALICLTRSHSGVLILQIFSMLKTQPAPKRKRRKKKIKNLNHKLYTSFCKNYQLSFLISGDWRWKLLVKILATTPRVFFNGDGRKCSLFAAASFRKKFWLTAGGKVSENIGFNSDLVTPMGLPSPKFCSPVP